MSRVGQIFAASALVAMTSTTPRPAAAAKPVGGTGLEGPLVVEATAYNCVEEQTEGHPEIAAWGDRLIPGINAVAVSNDLLDLGLVRGSRVRIEGLPGEYLVLDRMPAQWQRKIDIYMGKDVTAAKNWGRRRVRIYWQAP
jgi:3D (Asp-Asp-Asp) domain-containing protein